MRRRGAQGWRRWMLGASAGFVLFALSGVTVAMMAASAGLLPSLPTPSGGLLGGHPNSSTQQQGGGGVLGLPSLPSLLGTPGPTLPVTTPTLSPCIPVVTCPPPQTPTPTPTPCASCSNHGTTPTPTPTPAATQGAGGGSGPGSSSGASSLGDPGAASTPGAITVAPPPVTTLSPFAGISFGKAPFLWPLFIALDFLGLGAVVVVLRKTWSKPVTD